MEGLADQPTSTGPVRGSTSNTSSLSERRQPPKQGIQSRDDKSRDDKSRDDKSRKVGDRQRHVVGNDPRRSAGRVNEFTRPAGNFCGNHSQVRDRRRASRCVAWLAAVVDEPGPPRPVWRRWALRQPVVAAVDDEQPVGHQRCRHCRCPRRLRRPSSHSRRVGYGNRAHAGRSQQPTASLPVRTFEPRLPPTHPGRPDGWVGANAVPHTGKPQRTLPATRRPRAAQHSAEVHQTLVPRPGVA